MVLIPAVATPYCVGSLASVVRLVNWVASPLTVSCVFSTRTPTTVEKGRSIRLPPNTASTYPPYTRSWTNESFTLGGANVKPGPRMACCCWAIALNRAVPSKVSHWVVRRLPPLTPERKLLPALFSPFGFPGGVGLLLSLVVLLEPPSF